MVQHKTGTPIAFSAATPCHVQPAPIMRNEAGTNAVKIGDRGKFDQPLRRSSRPIFRRKRGSHQPARNVRGQPCHRFHAVRV